MRILIVASSRSACCRLVEKRSRRVAEPRQRERLLDDGDAELAGSRSRGLVWEGRDEEDPHSRSNRPDGLDRLQAGAARHPHVRNDEIDDIEVVTMALRKLEQESRTIRDGEHVVPRALERFDEDTPHLGIVLGDEDAPTLGRRTAIGAHFWRLRS
jgi:hypothetical protein